MLVTLPYGPAFSNMLAAQRHFFNPSEAFFVSFPFIA